MGAVGRWSASIKPTHLLCVSPNGEATKVYSSSDQDAQIMGRFGSKTGRLLDGRTHDSLPWVTP